MRLGVYAKKDIPKLMKLVDARVSEIGKESPYGFIPIYSINSAKTKSELFDRKQTVKFSDPFVMCVINGHWVILK
jgi:hypothetical protein